MAGKSSKSRVVSIRLSVECIEKIERALLSVRNGDSSINDYCKNVITRHAFRHHKKVRL